MESIKGHVQASSYSQLIKRHSCMLLSRKTVSSRRTCIGFKEDCEMVLLKTVPSWIIWRFYGKHKWKSVDSSMLKRIRKRSIQKSLHSLELFHKTLVILFWSSILPSASYCTPSASSSGAISNYGTPTQKCPSTIKESFTTASMLWLATLSGATAWERL